MNGRGAHKTPFLWSYQQLVAANWWGRRGQCSSGAWLLGGYSCSEEEFHTHAHSNFIQYIIEEEEAIVKVGGRRSTGGLQGLKQGVWVGYLHNMKLSKTKKPSVVF